MFSSSHLLLLWGQILGECDTEKQHFLKALEVSPQRGFCQKEREGGGNIPVKVVHLLQTWHHQGAFPQVVLGDISLSDEC